MAATSGVIKLPAVQCGRGIWAGMAYAAARHLLNCSVIAILTLPSVKTSFAEPGDVLALPVPVLTEPPPKVRDLQTGDATVSTQTGAFQYRYSFVVPPGRLGMQPSISLSYSFP